MKDGYTGGIKGGGEKVPKQTGRVLISTKNVQIINSPTSRFCDF